MADFLNPITLAALARAMGNYNADDTSAMNSSLVPEQPVQLPQINLPNIPAPVQNPVDVLAQSGASPESLAANAGFGQIPMQDTRPSMQQILPMLTRNANEQAGQILGTYQPPPELQEQIPQFAGGAKGALQKILLFLQNAAPVALAEDPGKALGQFLQQRTADKQKRQDALLADRRRFEERKQNLTADILSGNIAEDRASRAEDRATSRESVRDNRNFAQTVYLQKMNDIQQQKRDLANAEKDAARQKSVDERAEKERNQKLRVEVGNLTKTYRLQGAEADVAKELAEYDLGIRDNLSEKAQKGLDKVIVDIKNKEAATMRLQQMAARAGSGGSGRIARDIKGDIPVMIYDPQGNPVRGANLNDIQIDKDTGSTNLGQGYTYKIIPQEQAQVPLRDKLASALKNGMSIDEARAAVLQEAGSKQEAEKLIKEFNLNKVEQKNAPVNQGPQLNALGRALKATGQTISNAYNQPSIRPSSTGLR